MNETSIVDKFHGMAAGVMRGLPQFRGRGRISSIINRAFLNTGAAPLLTVPMAQGHRLILDARVPSHVWAAYSGRYNDVEIETLARLIPKGGVAIDVGANIGFYSVPLALAAKAKGGRLIAFEPFDGNLERLRLNLELNSTSDYVRVEPVALSDRNGEAELELREDFVAGGEVGNAVISYEGGLATSLFKKITIKLRKLDDLWPTLGVSRLDIVKADIEGHEVEFMNGAVRTLGHYRPVVQLEMNRGHYSPRGIDIGAAFTAALPPNYVFLAFGKRGDLLPVENLSSYAGYEDILAVPADRSDIVSAIP